MFRFLLFLFDILNGNLYLFHNDSFNNVCFKSLCCDIFIFSIVVSDISFICFILLLCYVKVSILLCIYSLYSTYLRNCKMMFVLFFYL